MSSTPKTFHEIPNAGEYWMGRVVSALSEGRRTYGHIAGFYRTDMGEVGIRIVWEGGDIGGLHYCNIDLH